MTTPNRYSFEELKTRKLDVLEKIGKNMGLRFNKNHTRAIRAEKIVAAYNELDASVADSQPPKVQPAETATPSLHERKQSFEDLCEQPGEQTPGGSVSSVEDARENRGGGRVGAGRPPGMTNQMALYNSLPDQSHPAIRDFVLVAFKMWSVRSRCPRVQLSQSQAVELALPWTHAAHLMGVREVIPAWLMVALSCVWTTAEMVSAKSTIAREAVAKREVAGSGGAEQTAPATETPKVL